MQATTQKAGIRDPVHRLLPHRRRHRPVRRRPGREPAPRPRREPAPLPQHLHRGGGRSRRRPRLRRLPGARPRPGQRPRPRPWTRPRPRADPRPGGQARHHPLHRPRRHRPRPPRLRPALRLPRGLQAAVPARLPPGGVRRIQPARQRTGRRQPGVRQGRPAAALLARRLWAARPGQPRLHPVLLAADPGGQGHLQEAPGDRQHPRHGPHGHRRRPHRQLLPRRLGRGRRQVERPRRDRPPGGHQALHPQPRQRLRFPARRRPAGRPGPADPQFGHPETGVLPQGHRPAGGLAGDGHLLGARRPVQVPRVHRPRRLHPEERLRPGRPGRPQQPALPALPRQGRRGQHDQRHGLRHGAVRDRRHRLHDVLLPGRTAQLPQPDDRGRQLAERHRSSQSLREAKISYDNLAALRKRRH